MALVLGKAAAFDARTVGEADVEAWLECIGDELDFQTAMERVTEHYRTSTQRLMPADLLGNDGQNGIPPWERDPGFYDGGRPVL
jgi:hypothetical protein